MCLSGGMDGTHVGVHRCGVCVSAWGVRDVARALCSRAQQPGELLRGARKRE